MPAFQRARNEEQREARRLNILRTATAMLADTPVSGLSLNELGRRAGMAKSNILRYFESREAVLLALLGQHAAEFLTTVGQTLPAAVDRSEPVGTRARQAATGLATAFAADPMLCELLSAQASILEHNVSVDVAARTKRDARDGLAGLAALLRTFLPELSEPHAAHCARLIIMLTGTIWTNSHPSPAVVAAYKADPSLVFLPDSFADSLGDAVATVILGALAEGGRRAAAGSSRRSPVT
jgi:AcrR family transcriptional regulator